MAEVDLGTARGKIEIDASGAEYGFGRATAAQADFVSKSERSANALGTVGKVTAAAGLGIAAGLGVAVNSAANFEERLSGIKAVSGATSDEMEQIRQKALQLGADTKFSASESALAMEELIKAGLSTEDVLNGAADATVNLAAAGEIELPRAAELAANAMNAFNLSAEDLPHVADLIAGAANASAISVEEFGMSMQQSSAVAALAGLSFDDLSLAIAAMGNAGIKGSDAGTSLKTMLQNLQPGTAKQAELFRELGIITEDGTNRFYDQEGSLKSLAEISDVLGGALEGMTDQQKQMALETLFGSDAIRAAAVVAGEGSEGFNELAESMGKVTAEEVAEERMNNLKGSMEQLSGSVETLLIIIGTPLLGALRDLVDTVTDVVNWFAELDAGTIDVILTIAQVAAVVLTVIGVLLLVASVIQKVRTAMMLLNATFFANPIGLFILLIAGLVAALVVLYNRNESVRKAIQSAWEKIKDVVGPIIEELKTAFNAMVEAFNGNGITSDGLVGFFERVGVAARAVWDFIQNTIIPGFEALVDGFTGVDVEDGGFIGFMADLGEAIRTVVDFIRDNWEVALAIFGLAFAPVITIIAALVAGFIIFRDEITAAIEWIVEKAQWFATEFMERFDSAFAWLQENVFPVFSAFGELVVAVVNRIIQVVGIMAPLWSAAWEIIQTVVSTVISVISTVITTFITIITTAWQLFGDNIVSAFTIAWNFLVGIVTAVLNVIKGIIQVVTGIITLDWSTVWEGIKSIFSGVWTAIVTIVTTAIEIVRLVIETAIDLIVLVWNAGWAIVTGAIQIAWALITGIVSAAISLVTGIIGTGINLIQTIWNAAWEAVKGVLSAAWNNIIMAVVGAIASVVSWLAGLPGRAVSALAGIISTLWQKGYDLIQGLQDGATAMFWNVLSWATGLPGAIVSAIGDVVGTLYDKGVDLVQGFIDGIGSMAGEIGSAIDSAFGGIPSAVGGFLGIGSPSKYTRYFGEMMGEGLIVGMDSQMRAISNMAEQMATATMVPLVTSAPASLPAGNTDNSIAMTFQLPGVANGQEFRQTISDPAMLNEIIRAVRAGRR